MAGIMFLCRRCGELPVSLAQFDYAKETTLLEEALTFF